MLAIEHTARLLARLAVIAQAADEAMRDADALAGDGGAGEGARWLPGIKRSLERIQLECADMRFSARELRQALPSPDTLQPRLW